MSNAPETPSIAVEKIGLALVVRAQAKMLDDQQLKAVAQAVDQSSDANPDAAIVVLDLSQVQFLPSLALGLLVQLSSKCKSRRQKLKLAAVSPQVRQVFAITRLDRIFEFVPSVEAAIG